LVVEIQLRRLVYFFFLFLALCAGGTGELYAGGRQEDRLGEAEQLIQARRYNEAIELLTAIMKEDPRRFDEAEELMARVREARQAYNDAYNQLIAILDIQEGETLNEQEAYDIIKKLEELDADPNIAAVEAFAQARRSIVFTVNDQRFQGLMNEAELLLEEQRYVEAVDTYLTGFGLHRELFEEDDYGLSVERQIDAILSRIRATADNFNRNYGVYTQRMQDFSSTEDPALIQWAELLNIFEDMTADWNSIIESAASLEAIRTSILSTETTDIPFLSTLRVLSIGRPVSVKPNGIAGAIERPLVDSLTRLSSRAMELVQSAYDGALESYALGNTVAAASAFYEVLQLIERVFPFSERWTVLHNSRATYDMERKIGPSAEESQSDRLYLLAMEQSAGSRIKLIQMARRLEEIERNFSVAQDAESIRLEREKNVLLQSEIELAVSSLEDFIGSYEIYRNQGVETEGSRELVEDLLHDMEKQLARARSIEGVMVVKTVELRYGPAENTIRRAEEELHTARGYVEGVQEEVPGLKELVTVRYPRRSISLAESVVKYVQPVELEVSEILALLNEEKEYIQSMEEIVQEKEKGRQLLERIASLRNLSADILRSAAELNRQADIALSEGDIRLQQALNNLESENFEAARERLEQAGNALSRSLGFREDPEVRKLLDERIPEVGEEIIFRQNQLIVREVRRLITRGRDLFFQEKFIEAEQVLNRAQSRWRLTHSEDDPEVSLWLTRVKRALEATSGVTIEEGDPLFADMMQVLNLARDEYTRGKALYEEGRKAEAEKYFRSAEQKVEYIKEPFPNNHAAGVLYLQILQFTEPEDFESIFRGRFHTAMENLSSSPEESYRELQVLREIKPDYPGLDDALYRAEIATGIRQPPPDPSKLARARELYRQAEDIFQRDVRAQFPIALAYLNEAINLDPDYREAIVLKDRIQTGQGGQVTVVLSSVDQQKLNQAENFFIAGRYFEASALVEQLWQNPGNRSNPKLVELRRRIQSQL
jgi:hypothetical protein